jgi:cobalt-zinc-cadmium resistance protein CzcA
MIDKLIAYCVHNRVVVFAAIIGLIAWGTYSAIHLPIDAVPDITNNQVQVMTSSQALSPQEVEQFITYPLEMDMATIPDVEEIRSISRFGLSVITIVFKENVDIYRGRQLVSERLMVASQNIPPELGMPELGPISTGLGEIYQYIVKPDSGFEDQYSLMELRTIQDWIIKRQLLGTEGVADISSFGGFVKEYEVAINPRQLKSFNLTIPEVIEALKNNNENTGSAYIEKSTEAYFIRGLGLVKSLSDIEQIKVKTLNNLPILVRDIATVQFGTAVRYGAMTHNDDGEAVGGIVLMLKGANSNEVIGNVKKRIEEIKPFLPEGISLHVFLDRSDLIQRVIKTVAGNMLEGSLIVIFVLVLLLGNIRAGFIVASVIPLSLLFAISLMKVFGISGNLMSLGAIDFGLIVDGSVIIVEAIVFRLHSTQSNKLETREDLNREVIYASSKIRRSASFGELIILIVYLPILTLSGTEGKMFKPMAITVAFAILGALILSVTYIPAISSLVLNRKPKTMPLAEKLMNFLTKLYSPALAKVLNHKRLVVFSATGLFAISVFLFTKIGGEFIPTLDEGDFAVEVRLIPGSSLNQSIETNLKVAAILKNQFPEVKDVIGKIGTAEIPTDPMPIEACDLMVILKEPKEWTSAKTKTELIDKMSEALEVIPGVEFGFMQPIQMRFNELMTGAKQDIVIKIFGEDLEILAAKADQVGKFIRNVEGVRDIYVEQIHGLPQILVEYRKEKLAQYGMDISTLNQILKTAFAGEKAGIVYEGQKRFDLKVRLDQKFRNNIDELSNLYIPLEDGTQIPLSELADITMTEGPAQISREKAQRKVIIGLNVSDRDVKSVVNDISAILSSKLSLPPGYLIEYGGQFENLEKGQQRLMIVVPLVLFFIAILLYFTFGSLKQTLLIFTAIPFAAIGGVFSLLLRGMPFSISAGVGFIALSGVAVLNGIVLIGMFNQLKEEGMTDSKERVLEGTKIRLRPVLMTALVASLGFLPMALSNSAGAEVQKPLATVVIGGLITSTLLTLFVLPILYLYSEEIKISMKNKMTVIILAIMFLPFGIKAQQPADTLVLNPEEAVNHALKTHPFVKDAELNYEKLVVLRKTAVSLDPTSISGSLGRISSFENDNLLSIAQEFDSPWKYAAQSKLLAQEAEKGNLSIQKARLEVKMLTRKYFYESLLAKERLSIMHRLEALYTELNRAGDLKYERGEISFLENLNGSSKLLEIQNKHFIAQDQYAISIQNVKTLLQLSGEVSFQSDSLVYKANFSDTSQYRNNPAYKLAMQQIAVSEAEVKLATTAYLPKIGIGFNTQTIKGVYPSEGNSADSRYVGGEQRFNYVSAEILLPLWFFPQQRKVQVSKLELAQAHARLEKANIELKQEISQAYGLYHTFRKSYELYHGDGLQKSADLIRLGLRSYQQGESGYLELNEILRSAIQINLDYIDIIDKLNHQAIYLDYLLEGINQ